MDKHLSEIDEYKTIKRMSKPFKVDDYDSQQDFELWQIEQHLKARNRNVLVEVLPYE